MQIDPWGSNAITDYQRLRESFGIETMGYEQWNVFKDPHPLFKRNLVFGHRDFQRIRDAVKGHDPWAVMTGLMPSGDMHLGHKMVLDQVIAHQQHGADVHIAIADFEAVAARGLTLSKAREIAIDQYVRNHLALGLLPEEAEVYFQTKRHRVRDLADQFANRTNFSQMTSMYGFTGETKVGHIMAPLIQAADILHVQQDDLGGPRATLVPVGVDQDPHLRLTRDLAGKFRRFNLTEGPEGWVLALKDPQDAPKWLDIAEAVLDDQGLGTRTDRKRDDRRALIQLGKNRTPSEIRALDLALAQKEAKKRGESPPSFLRPSATFHRFMTGLQGGKMSSSKPETSIYLTEDQASARKKLMASVTGGKQSAEEQRRDGGVPESCPVYELYLYHLAKDDSHLEQVYQECRTGERLCGGCKKEAWELVSAFLTSHKERRDETEHLVTEIVSEN